jgi:hypothetical protein
MLRWAENLSRMLGVLMRIVHSRLDDNDVLERMQPIVAGEHGSDCAGVCGQGLRQRQRVHARSRSPAVGRGDQRRPGGAD